MGNFKGIDISNNDGSVNFSQVAMMVWNMSM